jgi:hypothetical protein
MATAPPSRVSIADALLSRRDGGPAFDVRATLNSVREGVQQVTDAAALRQILAGIAQVREGTEVPPREDVGTLEKVINIGKELVGTPTEREARLQEELQRKEERLQALDGSLQELKEQLWQLQQDRRSADRQDALGLADFMAKQTELMMGLLRDAQKPAEDPFRDYLAKAAVDMLTGPRRSDLESYAEQTAKLRELGLLPDPQQAVPPWLRDPDMFRSYLSYQADTQRIAAEHAVKQEQAKEATERAKALGPTLGALASVFAARVAGGAPDPAAGPEGPPDGAPPAPARRPARPQTHIIACPTCGERFGAVVGERRQFRCPNPECQAVLNVAPPAAGGE